MEKFSPDFLLGAATAAHQVEETMQTATAGQWNRWIIPAIQNRP